MDSHQALEELQKWVIDERLGLFTNDPDFHPKYEVLKKIGNKIRELKLQVDT